MPKLNEPNKYELVDINGVVVGTPFRLYYTAYIERKRLKRVEKETVYIRKVGTDIIYEPKVKPKHTTTPKSNTSEQASNTPEIRSREWRL